MPFVKNLGKTNMLTHIPEDIKLELVDGVLTLKAGSKLQMPISGGEFRELVITSDKIRTDVTTANTTMMLFWDEEAQGIRTRLMNAITSGSTAPTDTTAATWYDTTEHKIKFYQSGSVASSGGCLPLGIITSDSNGVISSIDQVFNGFGYIGSTVFALPNVKGLIPDGWNEDGTLKSIEFVTDTLLTKTVVASGIGDVVILLDKDKNIQGETLTTTITYDAASNYTLYSGTPQTWTPMVYFSINNSVISNFQPKTVGGKNRTKLYQLAKPKRTYYKYGKEPNASVVGSFGRITDGVAGGFMTGTFLRLPETIEVGSNTWERVIKITTGSDINTLQTIWGTIPDYKGMLLRIHNGGALQIYLSSSGSSWNITGTSSSLKLAANTDYYIKTSFNGLQYLVDVSTNGVDYTNYITFNSSTPLIANRLTIGGHGVTETSFDTPFLGSVDLNETYIKVDDEIIWTGSSYEKFGSWIDEGVVSGFSTSNYLNVPQTIPFATADSFELVIPFTLYQQNTSNETFIRDTSGAYTSGISIDSGGFLSIAFNRSSGGTYFIDYTNPEAFELNKKYWVKVTYDGTTYSVFSSTDGDTYKLLYTQDSSYRLMSLNYTIGQSTQTNYRNPFTSGSIDLSECYIKINDKTWWHGTKTIESTENDYAYYTDRLLSYSPVLKTGKHYVPLFESSTGGTYNATIPKDSKARIAIVGGGGAAAMRGRYDDRGYGWGGGSGGAFVGEFMLPAGTYSVTVGSANNNTSGQGGNTATLNPADSSTHDSYIAGVVRVGGGGSGHYNSNYVGAAGASATFEIQPLTTTLNKTGNAGTYNSGGKGSAAAAVFNGGASVYKGYGKGQGGGTSEYAAKRYWTNGTNGYVKIEVYSETENQLY